MLGEEAEFSKGVSTRFVGWIVDRYPKLGSKAQW